MSYVLNTQTDKKIKNYRNITTLPEIKNNLTSVALETYKNFPLEYKYFPLNIDNFPLDYR